MFCKNLKHKTGLENTKKGLFFRKGPPKEIAAGDARLNLLSAGIHSGISWGVARLFF